jgi:outer membrane protein OmpA-like peptidoglycan-associated protein
MFRVLLAMTVLIPAAMGTALTSEPARASAETTPGAPGEGVWVNYDFVPGPRVLFYEDFTDEAVGNFPRRLEFVKGNMEVAEWEGRRWLRAGARSDFEIPLPETLPARFTVEFVYFSGPNTTALTVYFADKSHPYVSFRPHISGIQGAGVSATTRTDRPALKDAPFDCRIMADGDYVKVYSNEHRTANSPKAPLGRSDRILVHLPGTSSNPVMITDLRIAAGGRKIYDELMELGTVILHGILFDTGSDALRPESTPTLKEIGMLMEEHPELKLAIEGHTDDRGDEASNQTLSERRAEAVRAYLVEHHGLSGERLVARGHGEGQPIDTNETAQGRQSNRRVELSVAP